MEPGIQPTVDPVFTSFYIALSSRKRSLLDGSSPGFNKFAGMASIAIPGLLLELVLFDTPAYLVNDFARSTLLPTVAGKYFTGKKVNLCGPKNEPHKKIGIIPALGSSGHWWFNMGEFFVC